MSKTIDDFVKRNPNVVANEEAEQIAVDASDAVELTGIILSVSENEVVFGHLGRRFLVTHSDVLSLQESNQGVPNPFGRGVTATISLKPEAKLVERRVFTAEQLLEGLPFPIARPSMIPPIDYPQHTAKELAWFQSRGITPAINPRSTNSGTYCGHNTTSPKWSGTNCTTYTNGMADDNNHDDGQSDEYYGDDATHDDFGADD